MQAAELIQIYRRLSREVGCLKFGPPVTHVYNPLDYARGPAERFLEMAASGPREVVFLGMNPGPWGMAQTGVPFGSVKCMRGWLGIDGRVEKPTPEHSRRPVEGFEVQREEVSGNRFWGWAQARFGTSAHFFERFFVANYCPLMFLEASGRNRTPDRLAAVEQQRLFPPCDAALREVIRVLGAGLVIGVGRFAEQRAAAALSGLDVRVGRILHPSPASPAANRGWQQQAESQLREMGVSLPWNRRRNRAGPR